MDLYTNADSTRLSGVDEKKRFSDSEESLEEYVFKDPYHEDVARLVHSPSFRRLSRKHQLLPSDGSDFVRTRSSHSNEVAQIATLLCAHLNRRLLSRGYKFQIRSDILIFAGLAHDIGHPPFGHLGEQVLNRRMLDAGGFEGNAQTLRVLARLEARFSTERTLSEDESESYIWDKGYGINPTRRCLASVLKYAREIPAKYHDPDNRRITGDVVKGFYSSEREIVETLVSSISRKPLANKKDFKSIEADIMDYADDVAYSIYDLEDSFKSGVLRPEEIMGMSADLLEKIANDVRLKIAKKHNPRATGDELFQIAATFEDSLDAEQVHYYLVDFFQPVGLGHQADEKGRYFSNSLGYLSTYNALTLLCRNDQVRRAFTENYIRRCVYESDMVVKEDNLPLSKIYIPRDIFILIEILKRVNYYLVIRSNVVGSNERKYEGMLSEIFDRLYLPGDEFFGRPRDCHGYSLLPESVRSELEALFNENKWDPRDIFTQKGSACDGTEDIKSLCEKSIHSAVPLISGFDVYQALSHKGYDIRSGVSSAIYRTMAKFYDAGQGNPVKIYHTRRLGMKRLICDYIANMTDRAAREFHERFIFNE